MAVCGNSTVLMGIAGEVANANVPLGAPGCDPTTIVPDSQTLAGVCGPGGFASAPSLGPNQYRDFGPRIGFAWDVFGNGKTSLRGGFGISYEGTLYNPLSNSRWNLPYYSFNAVGPIEGIPGTIVYGPSTCSSSGCVPSGAAPGYSTSTPGTGQNPGQGVGSQAVGNITGWFAGNIDAALLTGIVPPQGIKDPYVYNFFFGVQREIAPRTVVEANYVGTAGHRLFRSQSLNRTIGGILPSGVSVTNNAADGCPSGLALTGGHGCPVTPITENANLTWTNGTPVPGAVPLNAAIYGHPGQQTTEYNSRYDSLQLTLNRRLSRGLQVLAAYTWSRYFDQTSSLESNAFNFPGVNPFCAACMWAPSSNDAPQRFVASYTYTLPIYQFTHKWKRLTDDWNLSGIYTLQHGTPIAVFNFFSTSLTCDNNVGYYACPDRANRTSAPLGIRDPRNHNPGISGGTITGTNPQNLYFNPAAFTLPAPGTLGTASRNPLYGPGLNYGDLALEKRVHIDESRYLELQLKT